MIAKVKDDPNKTFKISSTKHIRWELFNLIFKGYRRTFQFVFFGFVQPVVIFAIFYFLFTTVIKGPTNTPSNILPGYILLAPLSTALMAFTNMLSKWKDSVLLKRISITPLTNSQFMLTFIGFYFITALLASFWMMAWGALFIWAHLVKINGINYTVPYVFQNINWGWLILALVQLIFIANCISVMISGLVAGINKAQGYTALVFFPSIFLGGFIIPNSEIQNISGLKWVSYFVPFKYPSTLSTKAWHGNVPNFYLLDHIWIPIIIGFAIAFGFLTIAVRTFKWHNK